MRSSSSGKRTLGDLDPIQACTQPNQLFRIEAGAHLTGENEVPAFEVAEQEGAEPNAFALRIGEAADH